MSCIIFSAHENSVTVLAPLNMTHHGLFCRNKRAARRAQNVLSTMENAHKSKKTDVHPDLDCYRNVLITMSRSQVSTIGSKIPKIFKSMEDNRIDPDTVCFDCAIETLKNCAKLSKGDDESIIKYAKAAEAMLERMENERDRSNTSLIKPSRVTYTNVIKALALRKTEKAAEKADQLLQKMISEYEEKGDESMRPTRDSYVGTIHAYGNSGSTSNYTHANEVLQQMTADYSQGNELACPDISSYHAVIISCSNTTSTSPEKQREALMLAISTVKLMKKSDGCNPNPRTYLLLLKCCTNLLPAGSEREKVLWSIFRSCCKDGLVNKKVLTEFQSLVSTDAYHKEVVHNATSYNGIKSIPETWTRSLGYKERTVSEDGKFSSKRNPIISVSGEVIASTAYNDHRMRRRWSKKNQNYLQGGRM